MSLQRNGEVNRMKIVLFHEKRFTRTILPLKVSGQHGIYSETGKEKKLLFYVTAENEKWRLKSIQGLKYVGEGAQDGLILADNQFYIFEDTENNRSYMLYTETAEDDLSDFCHYQVPENGVLTVGYRECDSIDYSRYALRNDTLGRGYLRIEYRRDGRIKLTVFQEMLVYRNGILIESEEEGRCGDELYTFGLRVLLGSDFVSVNSRLKNVVIHSLQKRGADVFRPMERTDELQTEETDDLFTSAPRNKRSIEHYEVTVDNPPKPPEEQAVPWAVMMGPSITMAFGSAVSAGFSVNNVLQSGGDFSSAIPTVVMAFCMMAGTVIWPVFARRFERRSRETRRKEAEQRYIKEMEALSDEIDREMLGQSSRSLQNHPELSDCIRRIEEKSMELWERAPMDDLFLDVTIGTGDIRADIELSHTKYSMSEKPTDAEKKLQEMLDKKLLLSNVPVCVNMRKSPLVGLTGDRNSIVNMTRAMLLELTALHDYNDLKILFICGEKERSIWKFVRWMPHVWSDDRNIRYFSSDYAGANELSKYLMRILEAEEHSGNDTHYLIVAADRTLAEKMKAVREYAEHPEAYKHVSMLALYDEKKYLPKNCSAIVDISDRGEVTLDNLLDPPISIREPRYYPRDPEDIFVRMANIELRSTQRALSLPTELTYFDMLQVGKPEHLDILSRWRDSNPVESLAAPIGVDSDGYLIKLDIHEKMHGPHGLIAGMTGSGKSEFIIAYIASMALHYSPEEVAFVLIDFKGGGMADVFRDLPHIAGTITNLDNNELKRSFLAIESELEKRQKLFKNIGEEKKISNIDIYKYQKLRREADPSLKPLPHLIIISDEFAELKQQHGDFMDQLIRIARIGRSLGVHLILATQKPEGVVNDQIKSNIRFKVCLKVQDRGDSQSVIGRPDAAWLVNPGRFYLQVGADEVFEYGQSPWSGASYHPAEQYRPNHYKRLEIINEQGQTIMKVSPAEPKRPAGTPEKQIDALVDWLSTQNIAAEKLWLNPLAAPAEVQKNDFLEETEAIPFVMNPVIGMYDDLRNQKHCILTLPMTRNGHTIVYGNSGSGKLSFLNQMLVSLMQRHKPDEVDFYILDYDSGSLAAFADAPHTNSMVIAGEPAEARGVLERICEEMDRRKTLFRTYGGDYMNYIANSGSKLPNIVLVIHNYSVFLETCGEALSEIIARLAREGKKYGIFVVITALSANAVKYTMLPLFANLFVLRQNTEEQYVSILGKTGGITPAAYKGRGLFKRGDVTYEFQTDMVFEKEANVYEAIRRFCESEMEKYRTSGPQETADKKLLPDVVTRACLLEKKCTFAADAFAVGLDCYSGKPVSLDFTRTAATLLLYSEQSGDSRNIMNGTIAALPGIYAVLDPKGILPAAMPKRFSAAEEICNVIMTVFELAQKRRISLKHAKETGMQAEKFEDYFVFLCEYTVLCDVLMKEERTKDAMTYLGAMITGLTADFRIHFIISDGAGAFAEKAETDENIGKILPVGNGILVGSCDRVKKFFGIDKKFPESCEKDKGICVSDNRTQQVKFMA